jgi:uncharacterized protein DUF4440
MRNECDIPTAHGENSADIKLIFMHLSLIAELSNFPILISNFNYMKIILLAFALFTGVNVSWAQPEKEVEAAIEKLRLAILDPTKESLANLTSRDLSYGHSNGLLENQSQFIEALVSGKSDFSVINLSDQIIQMNGKNTAIVRHKMKGETIHSGPAQVNLGVLTVWVKEKGGWKLLARQAFKL